MKIQLLLILVLLTNLKLLGSSRIGSSIRTVAIQGGLLGLLPFISEIDSLNWRVMVLTCGTIFLKGFVFTWLLFKAINTANVSREIQPFAGYVSSILYGIFALIVSFWLGRTLSI
ncbi:MAG: hydrogenase, partial [Limisphaerales bacterium]